MDNTSNIIELFPVPIYKTYLPKELSVVCNYFDGLKHWTGDGSEGSGSDYRNYGTHSEDTYVLDNPKCEEFAKYVLHHIDVYNRESLGYVNQEWMFSQSWISYKHPGQSHVYHTHPNSIISAVFFYGNVGDDTSKIVFHQNASFQKVDTVQLQNEEEKRYAWRSQGISFDFQPGTLLIFPSFLPHSVPENKTRIVRKSLSMNIVPKNGLGDKRMLTELLFKRFQNEE